MKDKNIKDDISSKSAAQKKIKENEDEFFYGESFKKNIIKRLKTVSSIRG